jgi:hypothetical protein
MYTCKTLAAAAMSHRWGQAGRRARSVHASMAATQVAARNGRTHVQVRLEHGKSRARVNAAQLTLHNTLHSKANTLTGHRRSSSSHAETQDNTTPKRRTDAATAWMCSSKLRTSAA